MSHQDVAIYAVGEAQTRDPLLWPFAQNSIWNTPIGSDAVYVDMGLGTTPTGGGSFSLWPGSEREKIILKPTSPQRSVIASSGGWGGNRCTADGPTLSTVARIPDSYTVPSGGSNSAATILRADGRTVDQWIAFARCTAGGNATAWNETFVVNDIISDTGENGSHGGSQLSAFGGCLRIGELAAGTTIGPRHAIKFNFDMFVHGVIATQTSTPYPAAGAAYRWPATTCDSYAANSSTGYGRSTHAQGHHVHQGSLLAIPASTDITAIGLVTDPAKALAWTLQNYGAYIVDDLGANDSDSNSHTVRIEIEDGPDGDYDTWFNGQHGFHFEAGIDEGTDWVDDWGRIWTTLALVSNNSVTSVGGGGTPRQPLAPPFA